MSDETITPEQVVTGPEGNPDGGNADTPTPVPDKPNFAPIESQEEFDKRIGQRLAKERDKYADYDDLKSQAAEYQKYLDSQKDEQTKLNEAYEQSQQELADLRKQLADHEVNQLRAEIAAEKGLTLKQAKRLSGTTREELEADADDLLDTFPTKPTPPAKSTSTRPIPTGGADPAKQEADQSFDAGKKADELWKRLHA